MRVLLDTHALLWSFNGDPSLSPRARRVIEDTGNEILVSAACAWEIATKVRFGKLPSGVALITDLEGHLERLGFEGLPVSIADAIRAGALPGEHRDPFDRMLISQALGENVPIVSSDRVFDVYHVSRVW
jgi:PIN domain nuclease of toxin-antitoxin system